MLHFLAPSSGPNHFSLAPGNAEQMAARVAAFTDAQLGAVASAGILRDQPDLAAGLGDKTDLGAQRLERVGLCFVNVDLHNNQPESD